MVFPSSFAVLWQWVAFGYFYYTEIPRLGKGRDTKIPKKVSAGGSIRMDEDVSKTSINMPVALHKRLKAACNDRGLKIGEGIVQAISAWIADDAPAGSNGHALGSWEGLSPAEEIWMRKLLYVLRHGSFSQTTGVQLSIECFEAVVKIKGGGEFERM